MKKILLSLCLAVTLFGGVVFAQDSYDGYTYEGHAVQRLNDSQHGIYVDGGWVLVPDGAELRDSIGESTTYNAPSRQAFSFGPPQDFKGVVDLFFGMISLLIPVVFGLALLFFFWGLAQFIWAAGHGNEERVKSGKQLMFWGTIALFVMFSIYGIIALLSSDLFGVNNLPIRLLQT